MWKSFALWQIIAAEAIISETLTSRLLCYSCAVNKITDMTITEMTSKSNCTVLSSVHFTA